MNREDLRALIRSSLRRQGFRLRDNRISLPTQLDKQGLRDLHREAVRCGGNLIMSSFFWENG
jgi:hypothetical protein